MKYIKTYEQVSLDKQKKWFDDMTVKEYDIIIPPTKIEELEELVSQLVDGEETSEDDMTKQWIADAKSGKDIGTLGHEAIHQLQPNKMFNKLPDLDFLGDPEVKWDDFVEDVERKQYYYSRPGEIMSFAWSYFINKDESIKKDYKRIGGDVNKVFLSYVDKYSKKAKNWLEDFKKQNNMKHIQKFNESTTPDTDGDWKEVFKRQVTVRSMRRRFGNKNTE